MENRNKIIEKMAKDFCISLEDAKYMYEVEGYRKETQGECEYCKTGEEKCQTCTEFYVDMDNRCSGYDDGKCIEYTPVKYCFNCGAKMKGAE